MRKICKGCGKEFETKYMGATCCCVECYEKANKSLIYGVGVNDYYGSVKFEGKHFNFYKEWRCMFYRTIKKYSKNHEAAYKDVYVCEEWHYLSNFKKWYDEHYIDGNVLDKDICSDGTRCYSPQNCAFVPKAINNLLVRPKYQRDVINLPFGVKKRKGKEKTLYYACVRISDKDINSKAFNTPEEAHEEYIKIKTDIIKQQAQKYYDLGKIEKRVYNALMNYKFEL